MKYKFNIKCCPIFLYVLFHSLPTHCCSVFLSSTSILDWTEAMARKTQRANEYRVIALVADERNSPDVEEQPSWLLFFFCRVQSWSAQKKPFSFFRNPSTFAIIIHNFSLSRTLGSRWNVGSTKTRKKILCKICKSSRSSPHSKTIPFLIHFLITNIFYPSSEQTHPPACILAAWKRISFLFISFIFFSHLPMDRWVEGKF